MSSALATLLGASRRLVAAGEWFHGDTARRGSFADQRDRKRTERDPNALGPGIYWSRDAESARGYASPNGWIYTARMHVPATRTMTSRTSLPATRIRKLIDLAPKSHRITGMENWDEHYPTAIAKATRAYTAENAGPLAAVVGIFHDVFGWDAAAFLPAMVQLGFDCYRDDETGNLVVWNPEIIEVVGEERYS